MKHSILNPWSLIFVDELCIFHITHKANNSLLCTLLHDVAFSTRTPHPECLVHSPIIFKTCEQAIEMSPIKTLKIEHLLNIMNHKFSTVPHEYLPMRHTKYLKDIIWDPSL